ncbi:hypothetical protein DJ90_4584 [Paenibacillus macerans]|uniref:Uncharacterized protein n=1 Tax=Paenibacillus macerans TaxID=44252 RepID=A0A090Z9C0_PAEMA|nr:hypothetical protein DJ90_4584 [Paenibacillus macerans]
MIDLLNTLKVSSVRLVIVILTLRIIFFQIVPVVIRILFQCSNKRAGAPKSRRKIGFFMIQITRL